MTRLADAILVLALVGLAGCATQTLSPPAPLLPQAPSPQFSTPKLQFTKKPYIMRTPYFTQTGLASFYGKAQQGNTTASGATFNEARFTAAHRTLAFGTILRVTNMDNGRSVKVSINDRGPNVKNRIIDLSYEAARALDMKKDGVVEVKLQAFPDDQT
jgi:rare lipoprotein A